MKIIYTKEKYPKVIKFSNYSEFEIRRYLDGDIYNLLNYNEKEQYKREDVIVVDVEQPYEIPVLESGALREATRLEAFNLLGKDFICYDGEYIEDGELRIVEKPSSYHYWDANSRSWIVDLEGTKEYFRDEYKQVLKSKTYDYFNGYQMFESDIDNFKELKDGLEIEVLLAKFEALGKGITELNMIESKALTEISKMKMPWRKEDNSIVVNTIPEILKIYRGWLDRKVILNNVYNKINIRITEATNVGDLIDISWDNEEVEVVQMMRRDSTTT